MVSKWMSGETWFDATESVAAWLADAIDDQPARIANAIDLAGFKNPLASLRAPVVGWDRVITSRFPRTKAG